MKNLYVLAALSLVIGLIPPSLQENQLSLKDFEPKDSGTWYFDTLQLSFPVPLPQIPNYKIDAELQKLPNGKQIKWTVHMGDGAVSGVLVDTDKENQSTCELVTPSSGFVDAIAQGLVVGFCRQVRSIDRSSAEIALIVAKLGKQHTAKVYINQKPRKPSFTLFG